MRTLDEGVLKIDSKMATRGWGCSAGNSDPRVLKEAVDDESINPGEHGIG